MSFTTETTVPAVSSVLQFSTRYSAGKNAFIPTLTEAGLQKSLDSKFYLFGGFNQIQPKPNQRMERGWEEYLHGPKSEFTSSNIYICFDSALILHTF